MVAPLLRGKKGEPLTEGGREMASLGGGVEGRREKELYRGGGNASLRS